MFSSPQTAARSATLKKQEEAEKLSSSETRSRKYSFSSSSEARSRYVLSTTVFISSLSCHREKQETVQLLYTEKSMYVMYRTETMNRNNIHAAVYVSSWELLEAVLASVPKKVRLNVPKSKCS